MMIHYVATLADGRWHEEGWIERGGKHVAQMFEMTLTRVGDTRWPAGEPVPPR